jgi:hypothetical protein
MKANRKMAGFRISKQRPPKLLGLACSMFAALLLSGFEQPSVRVQPADSVGPRLPEKTTQTAVVRDYLYAWKSLSQAFDENRPDLLDPSFVGLAKEKLAETVQEQKELGMKTRYRDVAHDLKLVFYSPEGLSIQLLDMVDYEVQILDHGQVQAIQHVRARYVAVLTPTEVRWKARVFQAQPQ